MYFEIENTPERVRRLRRTEHVRKETTNECPRLNLAPFSRPPQVTFDNVLIGTSCERHLEVFNPSKCTQQLLTEVVPTAYEEHAPAVVQRVHDYMSSWNRSISSVEMLKSAAVVLANLARCRATGPNIYKRAHIPPLLKYMWRFVTTDVQLFLVLSTLLWLLAKYDAVREDLTEYLHTPENHKMMVSIKNNVDRVKRMTQNATKNKPVNPARHPRSGLPPSQSILLPALEPDYGIARVNQLRFFVDTQQAINCLFRTYQLAE